MGQGRWRLTSRNWSCRRGEERDREREIDRGGKDHCLFRGAAEKKSKMGRICFLRGLLHLLIEPYTVTQHMTECMAIGPWANIFDSIPTSACMAVRLWGWVSTGTSCQMTEGDQE